MGQKIMISERIEAPIERIYNAFLDEKDLVHWYRATDDWSTPYAEVDARVGGQFKIRFEDPTGENSFDYGGEFTELNEPDRIAYKLDDGRLVEIDITDEKDGAFMVTETFDAEERTPEEMQRGGWQAILMNLRKYLEDGVGK